MIATRTADPMLGEIARIAVEQLDAERVILFGSRARGDHDADSDYDVLAVVDQGAGDAAGAATRAVTQAVAEAMQTCVGRAVDLIVCTPAEFERRRTDVGTIVYVCVTEGVALYDRPPAGARSVVREKPAGPPESVGWWLERARSDLGVMERELAGVAPSCDAIAFHAHQGVEKLLKTALILVNVPPPRIHNLLELLERLPDALRTEPRLADACRMLEALWPKMRYPNSPMPTLEEATAAAAAARAVAAILADSLPDARATSSTPHQSAAQRAQ